MDETNQPNDEETNDEETNDDLLEDAPDWSDRITLHRMKVVAQAYMPEGVDLEAEMEHVSGLDVDEEGNITGEARFRKNPELAANQPTPPARRRAKPRAKATSEPARDEKYFQNIINQYG